MRTVVRRQAGSHRRDELVAAGLRGADHLVRASAESGVFSDGVNTIVAAIERADRRETPHTPWPLVQPLAMPVPTPTSRPAAIKSGTLDGDGAITGRCMA